MRPRTESVRGAAAKARPLMAKATIMVYVILNV
jgi:hypothetical protein